MTADRSNPLPGPTAVPRIDTGVAHSARFWNYLVGGKDNFEADRKMAEQVVAIVPAIAPAARAARAFLGRAVRLLAGEAGIRQFLDIGTGIPTAGNTHEVAQLIAPDSRIVYVDNDPIVLVHARSLLTSTAEGATAYIEGDANKPQDILAEAARTLDFGQPVAFIMLGILQFIPDYAASRDIVAQLLAAAPAGSYLVVDLPASDLDPAMVEAIRLWNQMGSAQMVGRSREQVAGYFDGLDLLDPGVVPMNEWRPADAAAPAVPVWAGIGRKL